MTIVPRHVEVHIVESHLALEDVWMLSTRCLLSLAIVGWVRCSPVVGLACDTRSVAANIKIEVQ